MNLPACTFGALIVLLGMTLSVESPCDLKKSEKGMWCNECEVLLEKDSLNDSGNCGVCEKAPRAVDRCVKAYYTCSCGKEKARQETCCDKPMTEVSIKSAIGFKCKGCSSFSMTARKCDDEDCGQLGKDHAKACQDSGLWPHGGTAPE